MSMQPTRPSLKNAGCEAQPDQASRSWAVACAVVVILAAGTAAPAHPIALGAAEINVGRTLTTVRLFTSAEDFLHFFDVRPDASDQVSAAQLRDLARRYSDMILADFVVRDACGVRIIGRVHSMEPADFGLAPRSIRDLSRTRLTHTIHYATAPAPSHLTFQQLFGRSTRFVPFNISATLTQAHHAERTTMRLTNGGNFETVAFDWDGTTAPIGPAAFNGIHATLTTGAASVDIELLMPLPILETWLPIRRPDPDFVDSAARSHIAPVLRALVRERLVIALNGSPREPDVIALTFEALGGPVDVGASERLSAWTGRVRLRLRYTAPGPLTDIELTWALFNNVVLSQKLDILTPTGSTTHRLSSYAPTWAWSRTTPTSQP